VQLLTRLRISQMSESLGSQDGMADRTDKYTELLVEKSDAVSRVCYWHHAIRSKEWERVAEGASRCLSKDAAERSLRHWQDIVEDLDVKISLAEVAWYDSAGLMGSVPKPPRKKSVAVGTDEPLAKRLRLVSTVSDDELVTCTDAARRMELLYDRAYGPLGTGDEALVAAADEAERLEDILVAQYGNADEWIAEALDADEAADEASPSDAESESPPMMVEMEVVDLTMI